MEIEVQANGLLISLDRKVPVEGSKKRSAAHLDLQNLNLRDVTRLEIWVREARGPNNHSRKGTQ